MVWEEDAIRYQAVKMGMLAQAGPKRLNRHDDAWQRLFSFLAAVAMTAYLSG
jgi:hypothetical protein